MRKTQLVILSIVVVGILIGPLFCNDIASAAGGGKKSNGYNLYFGDLHTHTELSDGTGIPEDAYAIARDSGADFLAITDHVQIWNAYDAWIMDEMEWQRLLAAADSVNEQYDDFVAIAAYEAWMLANCGEVNVYNVRELPERETLGYRYDRLSNFYDWLSSKEGAIGQFNHPLYVSDNFMDYDFLNELRDESMCVIEAYNDVYYDENYRMALNAGWHLMPSANSDTHDGDWIWNHEMRSVLLAESLTPESLYEAMRACRGYATLDKNLEIHYTLNGMVMGSNLSDPGATSYTASIQIYDPDGAADAITSVEILWDTGEMVVWNSEPSNSIDITVEFESEDARYFYVRVNTVSPLEGEPGITAWTAPVWTGN